MQDRIEHPGPPSLVTRRDFVRTAGALTLLAGMEVLAPAYARARPGLGAAAPLRGRAPRAKEFDLLIRETPIEISRRRAVATAINDTVPGPLLRFQEGENVVLRVRNGLGEDTSLHWHGLLVPPEMDGVPGVSFAGIAPGTTFVYQFPVKQYGTYWYHSHSGFQEQTGVYGPIIIDPAEPDPIMYDREYVIMLAEWTFEDPVQVLDNVKKQGDYYNFQRRTVGEFLRDVRRDGFAATMRERWEWARMRMNPTDILDITGATYTYLVNGLSPSSNWTGLFRPGERVRLRFINAGAATTFDVRIPGLPMTVVQVSGQNVQPVETDEFRIGIAETFDVIVQPSSDQAYTVFAESADRSGYARGTLAPREGMTAPVPRLRPRPVLTMMDMGMDHGSMAGMEGMDHADMTGTGGTSAATAGSAPASSTAMAGHDMASMATSDAGAAADSMAGMTSDSTLLRGTDGAQWAISSISRTRGLRPPGTLPNELPHEPDAHAPANAAVPMTVRSRLEEPGTGLGEDGWRVLVYTDLRALERRPHFRAPDREIEIHLTGNMERFMWSIDGKTFGNAAPIHFNYGERLRLTMVNDTMMQHPMHLHGMWMELENGHGEMIPRVHTVNVKPAERVSLLIDVNAPGNWAFHCHILYHMAVGMMRVVHVPAPSAGQGAG